MDSVMFEVQFVRPAWNGNVKTPTFRFRATISQPLRFIRDKNAIVSLTTDITDFMDQIARKAKHES